MSIYQILVIILSALLVCFSAVQLGLSGVILNYNRKYFASGSQTFFWQAPGNFGAAYNVYWLPFVNFTRSYILQVATGSFGVIFGILMLILVLRKKPITFQGTGKRAPRSITWAGVTSILAIFAFCIALPSIVVSFYDSYYYSAYNVPSFGACTAQHYPSTGPCSGSTSLYRFYPMTIEGWTCRLAPIWSSNSATVTDNARHVLPQTCRIAFIARSWTIPLAILPILIAIMALLEVRHRNIAKYRSQRESAAGLYPKQPSFNSVESSSPMSAIGTLPSYTQQSELDQQQRTEAGGKQINEAPAKTGYDEMPAEKHRVCGELPATRSNIDVAGSSNMTEKRDAQGV